MWQALSKVRAVLSNWRLLTGRLMYRGVVIAVARRVQFYWLERTLGYGLAGNCKLAPPFNAEAV